MSQYKIKTIFIMRKIILILFPILVVTACSSGEIGNSRDVNPETIYIAYNISYSENSTQVGCMAQFRFAGEDGTTLVLNDPSSVSLDNKEIVVDSNTNYSGAYYLVNADQANFSGTHTWRYTDAKGKTYTQQFDFIPFKLDEEIPSSITSDKDLIIKLSGLKEGSDLHCIVSDTSFSSDDIDRSFKINHGTIVIPSTLLQKLSEGPADVIVSSNYTKPLDQSTPEGGVLNYDYSLLPRSIILTKK